MARAAVGARELEIIVWCGILTVLMAAMIVVIVLGGRRLKRRLRDDSVAEPFTMQSLRDLRDRGEVTPDEYEKVRAALLGRVSAKTAPPPAPPAPPPEPPAEE
jgi:uncharacterized membrane protein